MKSAKALMEAGADVNSLSGADALTPLMIAAGQTSPAEGAMFVPGSTRPTDIAQGLLARGANVNAQSKNGVTPLMIAATHNNPPMIGILIDAGADVTLKNKLGQTAADVAELNGNLESQQAIMVLSTAKAAAQHAGARRREEHQSMKVNRLRGFLPIAGATALAVALCMSALVFAADLGEEDVNKAVAATIAERSKDGAFVFHDPKLDADLNLVFEKIKIVRGMEGYGWFANVIFHDKDNDEEAIRHRLLVQARGRQAHSDGHQGAERAEARRRRLDHGDAHAGRLVVASRAGASWRHGGDARLAGDERDPQLHRHP